MLECDFLINFITFVLLASSCVPSFTTHIYFWLIDIEWGEEEFWPDWYVYHKGKRSRKAVCFYDCLEWLFPTFLCSLLFDPPKVSDLSFRFWFPCSLFISILDFPCMSFRQSKCIIKLNYLLCRKIVQVISDQFIEMAYRMILVIKLKQTFALLFMWWCWDWVEDNSYFAPLFP